VLLCIAPPPPFWLLGGLGKKEGEGKLGAVPERPASILILGREQQQER